jgi:hypothetical protein
VVDHEFVNGRRGLVFEDKEDGLGASDGVDLLCYVFAGFITIIIGMAGTAC